MDIVVENSVVEQPVVPCPSCGDSSTHMARVRSALWQEDRLVVIEDIPALVCESCGERFYDDNTVVILDLMRGDGFPEDRARGELRVPVFSFNDRLGSELPS